MTFEAWPAIIIGWPAILVALALCVIGLARRKPGWLFVAAAVAAPFSLYLAGTPRFRHRIYMVYDGERQDERFNTALQGLRFVAARETED